MPRQDPAVHVPGFVMLERPSAEQEVWLKVQALPAGCIWQPLPLALQSAVVPQAVSVHVVEQQMFDVPLLMQWPL